MEPGWKWCGSPTGRCRGLVLLLLAVVWLGACETSLQAPVEDGTGESSGDVASSTDPDVTGDESDTGETGPSDTEDGPPTDLPVVNACGGSSTLQFGGSAASILEPCGCGGVLICNGTERLRCVGELAVNACGGCGVIEGALGGSCGQCPGALVCGPEGGTLCVGEGRANGCGGCGVLAGAPGRGCSVDGDAEQVWVCTTTDEVTCRALAGNENACGGEGPLNHDGAPALPGDDCTDAERLCGPGVLVCSPDGGALQCQGQERNAAGGCGPLLGEPGAACGCGGTWVAAPDRAGGVRCEGGEPNACGGCVALTEAPGEICGQDQVVVCVGADDTLCVPRSAERNPCGGTETPAGTPGNACGACNSGIWACEGPNRVSCVGDLGQAAFNPCDGSCDALVGGVVGGACGTCDRGSLVCGEGLTLACEDPGDQALNACGGCRALAGEPDEPCGACASWQCDGDDRVRCVVDPGLPGCDEATLGCVDLVPPCGELNRECVEGGDGVDAECGACLEGYDEVGESCEAAGPVARTCEEAGCEGRNRECIQPDPDTDAACGACLSGFEEDGDSCTPIVVDPRGLGAPCSGMPDCEMGLWCPTDTTERRCSPRPRYVGVELPFQWVPGGHFTMGSPPGEEGRQENEARVEVTLSHAYFMQRTEVTQAQWSSVVTAWNFLPDLERFMPGWLGATPTFLDRPAYFGRNAQAPCTEPSCPVERVNVYEAMVFANALSILEGLETCYRLSGCSTGTGGERVGAGCGDARLCTDGTFECESVVFEGYECTGYRLPTEAEWERAARGNTSTATYNGDVDAIGCSEPIPPQPGLDPIAWWCGNSDSHTHPVSEKQPNIWGLHDMLGNVGEWTGTRMSSTLEPGLDPLGPPTGSAWVQRGGSWFYPPPLVRAALRLPQNGAWRSERLGFRLVRTAP